MDEMGVWGESGFGVQHDTEEKAWPLEPKQPRFGNLLNRWLLHEVLSHMPLL